MVNEAFAALFPSGLDPLGRKVRLGGEDGAWRTIVGVVPDVTMGPLGEQTSQAMVYLPLPQMARPSMEMLVETTGEPTFLIPMLEKTVREIEPLATVFYAMPMEEVLRRRHWLHEALATLFSVFGVVALTLSAVGLGGIVAVLARARRREHGIRIAIGALPHRGLRQVLTSALRQVGLGLLIGLALAGLLGRLVSSRVFGVELWDPAVYGSVLLVVLLAGVLAVLTPAIQAARVDPSEVLRDP